MDDLDAFKDFLQTPDLLTDERMARLTAEPQNEEELKRQKDRFTREEVILRVRELRARLGQSQEQFAKRLDSSVRTVARYESVRSPSGKPLLRLSELARSERLHDLAAFFEAAFAEELHQQDKAAGASQERLNQRASAHREKTTGFYLTILGRILGEFRFQPGRASLKELVQNILDASENAALAVLSTCIQVVLVDGEELDIREDTLNALRKKLDDIVAPTVEHTKSNAERFAAVKIEQLKQHEKNLKLLMEQAQARLDSKSEQRAEVQGEPSAQVKKRKQLVTQESKA